MSNNLPRKKRGKNKILALLMVFTLFLTGALALLAAKDSAENKFTVGNVNISLTEPKWDAANPDGTLENIVAGQVITKDPTITNTGVNDAYVYIQVEVPKVYKTDIIDADGETVISKEHYPLFSFTPNKNWLLIDSQVGTKTDAYDYYLYAYNTKLAPKDTVTLFNQLTFANITEQYTENNSLNLDVKITAYAIQSDFYNNEATDAESAWILYSNQNNWEWPIQRYSNLHQVTYEDESGNVLYQEMVLEEDYVEMYFDSDLAKNGYSFDWINEATGETAYSGMPINNDLTLTASYKSTGYGSDTDDYLIYLIQEAEDGHFYAEIVGVDVSNSSYPNDINNPQDLIIPTSIDFTKPNTSSKPSGSLLAQWTEQGAVLFLSDINMTTGEYYNIPVEAVMQEAFSSYYSLNSSASIDETKLTISVDTLVVPDSVATMGENTFAGYGTLSTQFAMLKEVFMPYGTTEIPVSALGSNPYLTSVHLPNSVKTIGEGAFNDCSSLNKINIPDSISDIGSSAFTNCEKLTDISLTTNMSVINDYVFSGCTSLNNIVIPENITEIGNNAFQLCDTFTEVNIPQNVTHIGELAFDNCLNLSTINVSENNKNYSDDNGILYNKNKTELILCPIKNEISDYAIPESVLEIADYAFAYNEKIISVTIPEKTKIIGSNAFRNCVNIKNINFAEYSKLATVKTAAFAGCTSLENIAIPDGIAIINSSTFYGCKSLKTISLPSALESVEFGAFTGCSNLMDVYYAGSDTDWNLIAIKNNNNALTGAALHYNS